ncbi:dihydrofolate reductase [Streptococcus sp. DD12]|uniref:dihydrofolate reductase n=1 Tax=Streptococcus sp. DD12 TaxID=1777880 RepID=UPI00079A7689|nr:dihydrofolate reductase [Streptococcus sp. DD12]KXT76688.1 Dihydrofolate reductase [Streptococcus sp. DD12]
MTKKIIAIWAQDDQGLIGKDGHMPWHLPAELKHFKETTTGHAILMGRVTFEGMNKRLLPNRQSLILTHDTDYQAPGALVFHSVAEVLAWFEQQDKHLFITGGAAVYQAFADYYDQAYRTQVHGAFEGDRYFPQIDWSGFSEKTLWHHPSDAQNPYAFSVYQLTKEKKEG